MIITKMKAGLLVATLGGMLGLVPGSALADSRTAMSPDLPDHAAAEARGAGKDFTSSEASGNTYDVSTGASQAALDHQTLEAGAVGTVDSRYGTSPTVPDHQSAERRSAPPDQR